MESLEADTAPAAAPPAADPSPAKSRKATPALVTYWEGEDEEEPPEEAPQEPKPKRRATPAQLKNLEKAREARAAKRCGQEQEYTTDPAVLPPVKPPRKRRQPAVAKTLLSVQKNVQGLTIF
jgi:hypothetical protein